MQTTLTTARALPVIRLLVLALISGLLMFTAVVVMLNLSGRSPAPAAGPATTPAPASAPGAPATAAPSSDVLVLGLAALTVTGAAAFLLLPTLLLKSTAARWRRASTDAEREHALVSGLMSTTILRAAVIEAPALLAAVIFSLHGVWPVLVVPALSVLLLASLLPSETTAQSLRRRLQEAP